MHSNTSQTAEIMRSTVHTVFEEEENNLPNCAALGWGGGEGQHPPTTWFPAGTYWPGIF